MSRYSWTKHPEIDHLHATIDDARVKVIKHPLYRRLETLEQGNTLNEQHVFAAWDFMPLPKTLQQQLTCVDVPRGPAARSPAAGSSTRSCSRATRTNTSGMASPPPSVRSSPGAAGEPEPGGDHRCGDRRSRGVGTKAFWDTPVEGARPPA